MTFAEYMQFGMLAVMAGTLGFSIWSHVSNRRQIELTRRADDISEIKENVRTLTIRVDSAEKVIDQLPTEAQIEGLRGDIKRLDEKIGGLIQWIDRIDGYLRTPKA